MPISEDIRELIKYFDRNRYTKIDLDGSIHDDTEDLKAILKWLKKNQTATNVSFGENWLETAQLKRIAGFLKVNQTLTEINLGYNHTGKQGAKYIAEALKVNQTLATIYIHCSELTNASAKYIAEALKVNQTLSSIDLAANEIGDAGAKHISDALKVNKTLVAIALEGNRFSAVGAKHISEALKVNKTLLRITDNTNDDLISEKYLNRNREIFLSRLQRLKKGDKLLQEEAVVLYNQLTSLAEYPFSHSPEGLRLTDDSVKEYNTLRDVIRKKYVPAWNPELLDKSIGTQEAKEVLVDTNIRPDITQVIMNDSGIKIPELAHLISGYVQELKLDPQGRTQLMNSIISNNQEYLKETLDIIKSLPEEQQLDVFLAKDKCGKSAIYYAAKYNEAAITEIATDFRNNPLSAFFFDGFSYDLGVMKNIIRTVTLPNFPFNFWQSKGIWHISARCLFELMPFIGIEHQSNNQVLANSSSSLSSLSEKDDVQNKKRSASSASMEDRVEENNQSIKKAKINNDASLTSSSLASPGFSSIARSTSENRATSTTVRSAFVSLNDGEAVDQTWIRRISKVEEPSNRQEPPRKI